MSYNDVLYLLMFGPIVGLGIVAIAAAWHRPVQTRHDGYIL